MATEDIVLYYFDARGRAELIRLIFAYMDVEYTDKRFGEKEDAFVEFNKFKIEKEIPFNQVPVLEINKQIMAQSQAIVRYLSKKYKLNGENDMDEFYADMIFCGVQDMHYKFTQINLFKETETTFINEEIPKWSQYFEKLLKKNKTSTYFVGKKLTYADLAIFNLYDAIEKKYPNTLQKFPMLKTHSEFIRNIPNIKKYLAIRKDSEY